MCRSWMALLRYLGLNRRARRTALAGPKNTCESFAGPCDACACESSEAKYEPALHYSTYPALHSHRGLYKQPSSLASLVIIRHSLVHTFSLLGAGASQRLCFCSCARRLPIRISRRMVPI
jgi:hypothetical protein